MYIFEYNKKIILHILQCVSEKEEVQEEEEVDWEKHTAQLIPCVKCKRTFLPQRIQKHQACCKKI